MPRRKKTQPVNGNKKTKHKQQGKHSGNGAKGKKQGFSKPKGPELEDELYKKGLRVKYMTADGNCFFRALGDQLYGHDRDHRQIRSEVIGFMEINRPLFELFVEPCLEGNEDFDSYIRQMRQMGQWAGDFEVHAASLCYEVDICIYQIDEENLQCLCNHNPHSRRRIHISYHGGEHYNSVRKLGDYEDTPPSGIEIQTGSSNTQPQPRMWSWKDEKRIMEDTGCHNDGLIHTYLKECNGNVNEVIERVIEWMRENDCVTDEIAFLDEEENNPLTMDCTVSDEEAPADPEPTHQSGNKVLREDCVVTQTKRPANNKPCPCGSRKVYKKCCKIVEAKRQRDLERREAVFQEKSSPTEEAAAQEMALLFI